MAYLCFVCLFVGIFLGFQGLLPMGNVDGVIKRDWVG